MQQSSGSFNLCHQPSTWRIIINDDTTLSEADPTDSCLRFDKFRSGDTVVYVGQRALQTTLRELKLLEDANPQCFHPIIESMGINLRDCNSCLHRVRGLQSVVQQNNDDGWWYIWMAVQTDHCMYVLFPIFKTKEAFWLPGHHGYVESGWQDAVTQKDSLQQAATMTMTMEAQQAFSDSLPWNGQCVLKTVSAARP